KKLRPIGPRNSVPRIVINRTRALSPLSECRPAIKSLASKRVVVSDRRRAACARSGSAVNHPVAGIDKAVGRALRNRKTADAVETRWRVLDCYRAHETVIHRHVLIAKRDRAGRSCD